MIMERTMLEISRGAIVCRKEDPVHVGRVTNVMRRNGCNFLSVRWFTGVLEYLIPEKELQLTTEWK